MDRLIIINKIDVEQVDLEGLLARIKQTYGNECLPLNLPAENGKQVVDLVKIMELGHGNYRSEQRNDLHQVTHAKPNGKQNKAKHQQGVL